MCGLRIQELRVGGEGDPDPDPGPGPGPDHDHDPELTSSCMSRLISYPSKVSSNTVPSSSPRRARHRAPRVGLEGTVTTMAKVMVRRKHTVGYRTGLW